MAVAQAEYYSMRRKSSHAADASNANQRDPAKVVVETNRSAAARHTFDYSIGGPEPFFPPKFGRIDKIHRY